MNTRYPNNIKLQDDDVILYYSACEFKREAFEKWMGMEISDEELQMANVEYDKVYKLLDDKYSPYWRNPAKIIKGAEERCSISRVLRGLEFLGYEVLRNESTR